MNSVLVTPEAYVVGDLHLGAGDQVDYFKQFGRDGVFVNFVKDRQPSTTTLILNGDIIDFVRIPPLEVPEVPHHLLWDEEASVLKLETVIGAHPDWFAALRGFVANGGRIEYIVGNHDLDVCWKGVQRRFCDALGDTWDERTSSGKRICFSVKGIRWGDVIVEHGHRYTSESCPEDPENYVHSWPRTASPKEPPPRLYLERVWSTDFTLHVASELERCGPMFSGRVGPLHTLLYYGLLQRERWVRPADLVTFVQFICRRGLPVPALRTVLTVRGDNASQMPRTTSIRNPEDIELAFTSAAWRSAIREALSDRDFSRGVAAELARIPATDTPQVPTSAIELSTSDKVLQDDSPHARLRDGTAPPWLSRYFIWEHGAVYAHKRSRPMPRHVVLGHNHRVADGELGGVLFNPGSWLPYFDLKSPRVQHELKWTGLTSELLQNEGLYERNCCAVRIDQGGEHTVLMELA
jgi:hypothetical protein